jgi:hypothetical protein
VSLRSLLIPCVIVFCGWSQEPEKPPCDAQHRGDVWPKAAAGAAKRPLEMCTRGAWKYRWEPVTVSVSQLAKERASAAQRKPRPAAK